MPRSRLLWVVLILLLAAGILLPVSPLYRPAPSDDPSVYFYVGRAILHGGAPYRDAWDHKQPLAYLVFAAAQLLSPQQPLRSLWVMWAIELVGLAGAGLAGFSLLERIAPLPACFAAIAAGLLTLSVILWGYALEELALPLQMLTLLAFARIQAGKIPFPAQEITFRGEHTGGIQYPTRALLSWGLVAGLSTAGAFFLKQSLAGAGIAAGVYLLLEWALCRRSWRGLAPLAGMAAGFALVALPLLTYLWGAGALADYWSAAFAFNMGYAALGPLERFNALLGALNYMSGVPGLFLAFALWIACALLCFAQYRPRLAAPLRWRGFPVLALSAGAGLALLSLLPNLVRRDPGFGLFQWLALLCGTSLFCIGLVAAIPSSRAHLTTWLEQPPLFEGKNLDEEDRPVPGGQQRTRQILPLLNLCVLYFPILLALITLSGRTYVYYFIPLIPFLILSAGVACGVGGLLLAEPGARRAGSPPRTGTALLLAISLALAFQPVLLLSAAYRRPANPPPPAIAAYVDENTGPGDTILVWGKELTYAYFLSGRNSPTRYFYQAPVALESYNTDRGVSAEILRDMQAHPPRLFLTNAGAAPPAPGTCPLEVSDQPNTPGAIYAFVCENYRYTAAVDEFAVWTRR